jgi:hypothetical protein
MLGSLTTGRNHLRVSNIIDLGRGFRIPRSKSHSLFLDAPMDCGAFRLIAPHSIAQPKQLNQAIFTLAVRRRKCGKREKAGRIFVRISRCQRDENCLNEKIDV